MTKNSKIKSLLLTEFNDFFSAFLNEASDEVVVDRWQEHLEHFEALVDKIVDGNDIKMKVKSDKDAPKKAKSGYIFFCTDKRQDKKYKDMENKEVTKTIANLWKSTSDAGKEKYLLLSTADKERYQQELKEYNELHNIVDEQPKKKYKKKAKKVEKAPKEKKAKKEKEPTDKKPRKKTAYFFFCKDEKPEVKAENPEFTGKEVTAEVNRRWAELKVNEPDRVSHYKEMVERQDEDDTETVAVEEPFVAEELEEEETFVAEELEEEQEPEPEPEPAPKPKKGRKNTKKQK